MARIAAVDDLRGLPDQTLDDLELTLVVIDLYGFDAEALGDRLELAGERRLGYKKKKHPKITIESQNASSNKYTSKLWKP